MSKKIQENSWFPFLFSEFIAVSKNLTLVYYIVKKRGIVHCMEWYDRNSMPITNIHVTLTFKM